MSDHYMSDSKCMTISFVIAAILAVIITLILGIWLSTTLSVVLLLVLLGIGWLASAYLCKARTINRNIAAPVAAPSQAAKAEVAPAPEEEKPAAVEPKSVAKPKAAASKESASDGKPELLKAARGGKADDLKKIKGVGPKLEKELNDAGVFHFDQIAGWSKAEVAWADQNLVSFKGRVSRDNWVDQAKELAKG